MTLADLGITDTKDTAIVAGILFFVIKELFKLIPKPISLTPADLKQVKYMHSMLTAVQSHTGLLQTIVDNQITASKYSIKFESTQDNIFSTQKESHDKLRKIQTGVDFIKQTVRDGIKGCPNQTVKQ